MTNQPTGPTNAQLDGALLMLRVVVGVLFILHGIHKITTGVDWMTDLLQSHGLPGFLRYGVYIGEVLAPALLIAGLFTRPAGAIIALNMIFALFLAHIPHDLVIGTSGGFGIELQLLFLFSGVFFAIVGGGRFGLGGGRAPLH